MKIYWDTLDLDTTLQQQVDSIFNSVVRPRLGVRNAAPSHVPELNLGQDNDNLYAELEAPGIDPKSLEVSIEDNTLLLSGKREGATESNDDVRWIRRERNDGAFSQRVRLPLEIDADKVTAEYEQGILRVTLPKAAAAKPKQIEVKVS